MKEKNKLLTFFMYCFLFSFLSSCGIHKSIEGSYKNFTEPKRDGKEVETGDFLLIQKQKDKSYLFALSVSRGAPSYNSGFAKGKLIFDKKTIFYHTEEYGGECTLTFIFNKMGVNIKQNGSDVSCGFGNAVSANRFMKKVSSDNPIIPDGPPAEW
ncbi:MAG: hypothetical protein P8I93_05030 [Crocinitomicaceae bacterium]|nr:hypothetical protein [Crocinitomicaceae bacterium]